MRNPGEPPPFDRLIRDIERARSEWDAGNREKAEGILRVVGSVAIAEARERPPGAPIPE